MGPKASTPAQTTPEQDELKINHPIFGIAKQIRDKQDKLFIKTQVRLANKQQFDNWVLRLNDVPANDSLMLPTAQYYTNEGLCGNSGIAHITYDNFPYLLSDEITNRECLNKKLFEENQLWYLVYTLLSAAFTYHRKGAKVGDMRPDNIFINEDGQVKVACVDSWPGQQTNYAKAFYEKQITYLAPEQIKDYQFGKMEQSVDRELAETFSIGLTCLDAATLSQSKSMYSKNFKFSYEKLEQRINQFRKYGYSELLTLTIENMCEVDTEYRSTSREILQWLLPYEESIVNLEDFQVHGLPEKMKLAKERQMQNSNMRSQTNNSQYVGSAFIQPSTYVVNSRITVPTYSQPPVQITHFNPSSTVFKPLSSTQQPVSIHYVNQPATHQIPTSHPQPGLQNYYAVNSTTINSTGSNIATQGPKFTLQQINQQLEQSRRLFPQ